MQLNVKIQFLFKYHTSPFPWWEGCLTTLSIIFQQACLSSPICWYWTYKKRRLKEINGAPGFRVFIWGCAIHIFGGFTFDKEILQPACHITCYSAKFADCIFFKKKWGKHRIPNPFWTMVHEEDAWYLSSWYSLQGLEEIVQNHHIAFVTVLTDFSSGMFLSQSSLNSLHSLMVFQPCLTSMSQQGWPSAKIHWG